MTRRMRFFINGAWLTAVALAMRTVGLLFGAYVSRTVGAEGVGLFTLIMTVFAFASTFATAGIGLAVTRLVAAIIGEGREGPGAVLRGAALYAAFFGGTATICLLLLSEPVCLYILKDARAIEPLRVLALSLLPTALGAVFSGYFVGVRKVGYNGALGIFSQIVRVGLTLVLILRSNSPEDAVLALCYGSVVSDALTFVLSFVLLLLSLPSGRRKSGVTLRPVIGMALPLAISAYIRSILLSVEHNLIPRGLEKRGESHSEALASYGILHGMALPVLTYPMALISSFAGLLVPEFAEEQAKGGFSRMERCASEAMNATMTFGILCSVLVHLFSEELGYILYGSWGAGYYIAFLAPVVTVMYLDHITDSILKGIGEHVYSMWVNIVDATLSVILVVVLIPKMGITGYAVVILVMEGFNFILSYTRLRRSIRPRLDIMRCLVLPAACAGVAACLTRALFSITGRDVGAALLICELVFSLCATFVFYRLLGAIVKKRS